VNGENCIIPPQRLMRLLPPLTRSAAEATNDTHPQLFSPSKLSAIAPHLGTSLEIT